MAFSYWQGKFSSKNMVTNLDAYPASYSMVTQCSFPRR